MDFEGTGERYCAFVIIIMLYIEAFYLLYLNEVLPTPDLEIMEEMMKTVNLDFCRFINSHIHSLHFCCDFTLLYTVFTENWSNLMLDSGTD